MKGGGGQQQNGAGSMDVLWISAFFVLLLAYFWYAHSEFIMMVAYGLSNFKLSLLEKFYVFIQSLGLIDVSEMIQRVQSSKSGITVLLDPSAGLNDLKFYTASVNSMFAYFYTFFAICYIAFKIFMSKANSFKKAFNMKTLRAQEQENWPYISSVPKNLLKTPLDEGPFAMSTQPLSLVLNGDLAKKNPVYGETKLEIIEDKTYDLLVRQMGPFWTGKLDCMPNYAKALFAIFAAKGNGDDDSARKLIDQIALSSGSGSLDFSGSTRLLFKHIRSRGVGMAVSPHAYLLTAMASLLEYARTGGVVAMAELIWLKKVDRRMWYMLQSVGRQTPFVEVAAAYAHWIVEKKIKRPLKTPMVGKAVESIILAIKDIKYNPEGY